MKILKPLICNAVLLWAFSPVSLATAIRFDDPKFVTLSDGRRVEFGQGIICTDDCLSAEIPGLADSSSRRLLWIPLITTVVICAILCRPGAPPVVVPNQPDNPPRITPTPPPRRDVPPRTEVPEPATLLLLGAGLAFFASQLKRKLS